MTSTMSLSRHGVLFLTLILSTPTPTMAWMSPSPSVLASSSSLPSSSRSLLTRSTSRSPRKTQPSSTSFSSTTLFYDAHDSDGIGDQHQPPPLILSRNDMQRLHAMRNRQKTLPLILGKESLLPGQWMEITSIDPQFQRWAQTLTVNRDELGFVGMHPNTHGNHHQQRPLTVGVTVVVKKIVTEPSGDGFGSDGSHTSSLLRPLIKAVAAAAHHIPSHTPSTTILTVQAKERVDVQGRPWYDDSKSCFMVDLEVAQDKDDPHFFPLKGKQLQQAEVWFHDIPILLEQWSNAMMDAGISYYDNEYDTVGTDMSTSSKPSTCCNARRPLDAIAAEMDFTQRAFKTAALLNPSPRPYSYSTSKDDDDEDEELVCMDIRPALISCRNDYDRLYLVHTALSASIHNLQGGP